MATVDLRPSQSRPSSDQLRRSGRLGVAIVGCGGRGAENAGVVSRTRFVSLVSVMDANEATAQRVGDGLGVAWTTDYEAVLADPAVDIVFINSPHHLHAMQGIQAARAGKHVIVEKPLATTLEDAVVLARTAQECGVKISTWLGYRYTPALVKARQLVDAGLLGQVLGGHLTFHNHKPPSYYQAGAAGAGLNWRARWDTCGGGILLMTGIHYLDWIFFLTGLRVAEVSARYATLDSPAEVEDSIVCWLTLENGALVSLNMSACVQGGNSSIIALRMWGTEGHLSLAPPYQFFSTRALDGKRPERWNPLGPLPKMLNDDERLHISVRYLDRFAQAIKGEQPLDITVNDGLALQAVIEAIYRSARESRPITVEYPEL